MKILLINPNSEVGNNSGKFGRFVVPAPPVGIAYIAAVLQNNGFKVKVIDQFGNKMSNDALVAEIEKEQPRIVGFSVLTPSIRNTSEIVRKIKALNKNIIIVLGNMHPTVFSDMVLRDGVADIVVKGEGEMTMLDVAIKVRDSKSFSGVEGISYIDQGRIINNPDRSLIADINQLPFPEWSLFSLKDYQQGTPMLSLRNEGVPLLSSRGCNFKCTFCAQDKIYEKVRFRENGNIMDEIEYFYRKLGIGHFVFCGPYFPFTIKQGMEFCEEFMSRGLHKKVVWFTETRVDLVDLKLLKMMKKSGLRLIMYGFESGNQKVLNSMNKGITLEQSMQAMRFTKEAGILTLGLFILGMPGENTETCKDTIRFAKELDCDIAKFNLAVPYPGSRFFDEYKDKLSTIDQFEKFTSWYNWTADSGDLIFVPEGMTSEELSSLQKKAMFEFYMRPKIIFRHIFKGISSIRNLIAGGYILVYNFFAKKFKK
ncbi:MAG: radical SAM protein [Candidatus Omnitrophota bacterium]